MTLVTQQIECLDHGFVKFVESWGSDERIVEAARMSTAKGFLGWGPKCKHCGSYNAATTRPECAHEMEPGDEKLLRYLWEHKHATPFEMAGIVIEVQAPIFVFREWHRHRTQCLAGDTRLHFDLPGGIERRGSQKYTMAIKEVFEKFQPTVRKDRPQRQTNALFPRQRIQNMRLRCINEETKEVTHTTIVDVWESGTKPVFEMEVEGVGKIRCSKDHRFFTPQGWKRLEEIATLPDSDWVWKPSDGTDNYTVNYSELYTVFGAPNESLSFEVPAIEAEESWKPVVGWDEYYEVSNMGRVRRIAGGQGVRTQGTTKKLSPDMAGYLCTTLNRPGMQMRPHVHRLVLETFVGPCPDGMECRHVDGNQMNNWLSNLKWGTSQENAEDRVRQGRVPSLKTWAKKITSVKYIGEEMTYDIEVADPWHNFVAEGFVVHNSYNEMSARYTPLPDVNYIPSVDRLMINAGTTNKQAGTVKGATEMTKEAAVHFQSELRDVYHRQQALYEWALAAGVPKELARVHLPVGRYSRMRASANLRNWLAFLTLRIDPAAQWEIRQFANAVGQFVKQMFPRTWGLFVGNTVTGS